MSEPSEDARERRPEEKPVAHVSLLKPSETLKSTGDSSDASPEAEGSLATIQKLDQQHQRLQLREELAKREQEEHFELLQDLCLSQMHGKHVDTSILRKRHERRKEELASIDWQRKHVHTELQKCIECRKQLGLSAVIEHGNGIVMADYGDADVNGFENEREN